LKKRKNILVITYWSYKDALVQAYTLPYLAIIKDQLPQGSWIYLVTFEQKHLRLSTNQREQVKQRLKLQGIKWVPFRYQGFGILAFSGWCLIALSLVRLIFVRNLRFIHAWCTTAGSIGYFLSKFTGRPLIIDSYEPHAEAMVENNTWKKDSIQFRLLFNIEKRLTHHAKIIISATEGMRSYAKEKYGAEIENFYVKPACVESNFFSNYHRKNKELLRQLKLENKIVCVYAGKFGGIYLTNEVFSFFSLANQYWGENFRALLLTNHPVEELKELALKNNFNWKNAIVKFVDFADVPDYIGLGDFAITPVKPIPSKRYCTPIKDGEYWALGLPVVITKNISDDSEIIERFRIGAIIEKLDNDSYMNAIKKIDALLNNHERHETTKKIQQVAHQFRDFQLARAVYSKIYSMPED